MTDDPAPEPEFDPSLSHLPEGVRQSFARIRELLGRNPDGTPQR